MAGRFGVPRKGPYTAHLRTLAPNTIPDIVFETKVLKWAVYGPFGLLMSDTDSEFEPGAVLGLKGDQRALQLLA